MSEELIGQFGIGFYSTFMVADAVELLTRKAGESSATRGSPAATAPTPLKPSTMRPRERR